MKNGRKYSHKGNEYEVVGLSKMKDPSTRIWLDAVNYKRINEIDGIPYIRSKNDFKSKFMPVQLEIGDGVEITSMGKGH